ncbi:MAG: pesticin C-terminus-like muramidase [Syntrophales bacterium]
MDKMSDKAIKLILDYEGLDKPGNWPGGASGITIGIGYDLGYVTVDQFESDWGEFLPTQDINILRSVVGLRGIKAKNKAASLPDIVITPTVAEKVFAERTIPLTQFKAAQAFPGIDKLPLDAQGALVSLVYNRGTAMADDSPEDRRKEMRAIRDAVARQDMKDIAHQLRLMKRLWVGKGLNGLLKRRDAEAALVESCIG